MATSFGKQSNKTIFIKNFLKPWLAPCSFNYAHFKTTQVSTKKAMTQPKENKLLKTIFEKNTGPSILHFWTGFVGSAPLAVDMSKNTNYEDIPLCSL